MILAIRKILIYNNHHTLRRLLDNQYWQLMQSIRAKKQACAKKQAWVYVLKLLWAGEETNLSVQIDMEAQNR